MDDFLKYDFCSQIYNSWFLPINPSQPLPTASTNQLKS